MITHTHKLTITETEVHKRYVTWADGEPEREWACLTLLAQHAPDLAPHPVRRETVDGAPVLVMQRLSGDPLSSARLSAAQITALGLALRALYATPLAAAEAIGLKERRLGPSSLRSELVEWIGRPYDLSDCRDPILVEEALRRARHFLEHTDAPLPRLSVIGIADLNPANVLWDGSVCSLVDFEDGGLSDPAFELADHVEHLAGRGVYDPDALIDAVGVTQESRKHLDQWRRYWAIFWLVMLLPGNGGFVRNPPGTTETQAKRVREMLAA